MPNRDGPVTPCGWLIEALLVSGVGLGEIEAFLGRRLDTRQPDRMSLPSALFFRLFEWAAEATGDPDIGIHVAERLTARDIGLLGYLLENSDTLGTWVENVTTYHEIFSQDAELTVSRSSGIVSLDYSPVVAVEFVPLQDIWCSLGMIVTAIRMATDCGWRPLRCRFTTPPPPDTRALRQVLCPDLHFHQGANRIEMAEADLALPIPKADPILFSILERQADGVLATLSQKGELVSRLRLMITAHLAEGGVDTERAASELNMSTRKLHRELTARGTSFRKLRDDAIRETARAQLADPSLQITEVAHRLGYSESSAFTRAFTRLEGVTPRAFRARLAEGGATVRRPA